VRAQVDRDLATISCFDRLLGLIKNLGVTKTLRALTPPPPASPRPLLRSAAILRARQPSRVSLLVVVDSAQGIAGEWGRGHQELRDVKPSPTSPRPSLELHWSATVVRLKPEPAGTVDLEIRPAPFISNTGEHLPVIPSISSLCFVFHPSP
jgi:hypothetical protein